MGGLAAPRDVDGDVFTGPPALLHGGAGFPIASEEQILEIQGPCSFQSLRLDPGTYLDTTGRPHSLLFTRLPNPRAMPLMEWSAEASRAVLRTSLPRGEFTSDR